MCLVLLHLLNVVTCYIIPWENIFRASIGIGRVIVPLDMATAMNEMIHFTHQVVTAVVAVVGTSSLASN